jgi:hypothetical protein
MARCGSMVVNLRPERLAIGELGGEGCAGDGVGRGRRTGSFLRRSPYQQPGGPRYGPRFRGTQKMAWFYPPTLEEASVSELSVLDLPALGLPTRPINGSRGILVRFYL